MLKDLSLRWKLLLAGLFCALLAGLSGAAGILALHWVHMTMEQTTSEISRNIGRHNERIRLISRFRKIISSIQNADHIEDLNSILHDLNVLKATKKDPDPENVEYFSLFSEAAVDLLLQRQNLLVSRADINKKWAANSRALETISNLTLVIMDDIEFESYLQVNNIHAGEMHTTYRLSATRDIRAVTSNALHYLKTSTIIHLNISRITAQMNEMSGMHDIDFFRYRISEIQTLLNNTKEEINNLPGSDEVLQVSKLLAAFKSTSDEVTESQERNLLLEAEYQDTVKRIYGQIDSLEPKILNMTQIMKEHAEQALYKSSRLILRLQNLVLFFVCMTLILAITIAGFLSRSILNQLKVLNAGIEIVGRGDLSHTVDTGTGDEIGILSRAFDKMAANIRQSQGKLAKALEEARSASRAKSEFLANMSHELRTPLNAILGFARILERSSDLPVQYREDLNIISHSGDHLLSLINDVLNLAQIESGRSTVTNKVFDLHLLLTGIKEMFSNQAHNKHLVFTMETGDQSPRYFVADVGKLRQIIINIIGNAIKFTDRGSVSLKLTARSSKEQDAEALILDFVVEDTGVGIREDKISGIFEPFVQAGHSKDATAGTGLGLAICQKYLQLMGGSISVQSKEGVGTSFFFSVPVTLAKEQGELIAPVSRRVIGLAPGQPEFKILIAEDEGTNRSLLKRILESVGFTVIEAENGREAVEKSALFHPDFVWMDMQMPIMDGYEATEIIKQSNEGKNTPVFALTASGLEEQRKGMFERGCDGIVRKPFIPEELFAVMAEHLKISYLYEDVQTQPLSKEEGDDALNRQYLARIPAALRADLAEAALMLDHAKCTSLIRRVRTTKAQTATALQGLVDNYQFEQLYTLFRQLSDDHRSPESVSF
jgi:signal transduction histidine kinase/CheY-like chemotaxis protein